MVLWPSDKNIAKFAELIWLYCSLKTTRQGYLQLSYLLRDRRPLLSTARPNQVPKNHQKDHFDDCMQTRLGGCTCKQVRALPACYSDFSFKFRTINDFRFNTRAGTFSRLSNHYPFRQTWPQRKTQDIKRWLWVIIELCYRHTQHSHTEQHGSYLTWLTNLWRCIRKWPLAVLCLPCQFSLLSNTILFSSGVYCTWDDQTLKQVLVSEVCAKKRHILIPARRSNWEKTVRHSGICELQCLYISAKPEPSHILRSGYRIFSWCHKSLSISGWKKCFCSQLNALQSSLKT